MIFEKPSKKCMLCYDKGKECDCHCHKQDLIDCEHYYVYNNPAPMRVNDESYSMGDDIGRNFFVKFYYRIRWLFTGANR